MQNLGLHYGDISGEVNIIVEMENIERNCHSSVYNESIFRMSEPDAKIHVFKYIRESLFGIKPQNVIC